MVRGRHAAVAPLAVRRDSPSIIDGARVAAAALAAAPIDDIDLRAAAGHSLEASDRIWIASRRRRSPFPADAPTRLQYQEDGSVVAAVKLQELFGLAESPRLGPRRQPIVFELLAPNGRPGADDARPPQLLGHDVSGSQKGTARPLSAPPLARRSLDRPADARAPSAGVRSGNPASSGVRSPRMPGICRPDPGGRITDLTPAAETSLQLRDPGAEGRGERLGFLRRRAAGRRGRRAAGRR